MIEYLIVIVGAVSCAFLVPGSYTAARQAVISGLVCLGFVLLVGGYFSFGWRALFEVLTLNSSVYSSPNTILAPLTVAGYVLIFGGCLTAVRVFLLKANATRGEGQSSESSGTDHD